MEKSYIYFTLTFLTLLFFIQKGSTLECYACDRQDSNRDKCIKTSIQCEEHHDICWTRIQWGLPPYWIPYGDRMHYVWKGCDTLKNCTAKKEVMMPHCKRDWYDDWGCHECCSGDLCNYYATLGADNFKIPYITLVLSTFVLTLFNFPSFMNLLNV